MTFVKFWYSQSHASAIERIFTMFLGLGYVAFLVLELITVLEKEPGSACYNPIRATVCMKRNVFETPCEHKLVHLFAMHWYHCQRKISQVCL